jgi:hypothetical protein
LDGDATSLLDPFFLIGLSFDVKVNDRGSRWRLHVKGTYADAMVDHAATLSKAEATKVLRRVGFSEERIAGVLAELDDPIDLDRDAAVLEKNGINRDVLVDLMGGSP